MLDPGTARVEVGVAGRSSIESENRSVAGLMRSTTDIKKVASRTHKGTAIASRTGAHRAVMIASHEFARVRREQAKGVIVAS
jgi:hypothetical protein